MTRCHGDGPGGEDIGDDDVVAAGGLVAEAHPGVADADGQLGLLERQAKDLAVDPDDRGVDLEHPIRGAGSLRGEVAGQREGAATDVERGQSLRRRARSLDHDIHGPEIAEAEVRRVVEIDRPMKEVVEDEGREQQAGSLSVRSGCSSRPIPGRTSASPSRRPSATAGRRQPRERDDDRQTTCRARGASRPRSAASTTAAPSRISRTGATASSTNPVRNVPTNAPTVAIAEIRPTTLPEAAVEIMLPRAASGLAAPRTIDGRRRPATARIVAPTGPGGGFRTAAATSIAGATNATRAAATSRTGATSRRGPNASAARPPT